MPIAACAMHAWAGAGNCMPPPPLSGRRHLSCTLHCSGEQTKSTTVHSHFVGRRKSLQSGAAHEPHRPAAHRRIRCLAAAGTLWLMARPACPHPQTPQATPLSFNALPPLDTQISFKALRPARLRESLLLPPWPDASRGRQGAAVRRRRRTCSLHPCFVNQDVAAQAKDELLAQFWRYPLHHQVRSQLPVPLKSHSCNSGPSWTVLSRPRQQHGLGSPACTMRRPLTLGVLLAAAAWGAASCSSLPSDATTVGRTSERPRQGQGLGAPLATGAACGWPCAAGTEGILPRFCRTSLDL